MAGPGTPPTPPQTTPRTPLQEARERAQRRRPPGPRPAPLAPLAQTRPPVWSTLRARLRASAARGRTTTRLWLGPKRRGRASAALTLMALTPLLGPAPRAFALTGGALYLRHLEGRLPRRRALHHFRWVRWAAPSLRRTALAEIASRWYGRNAAGSPRRGVQRLARGVVLLGWAVGQWADAGALALMTWAPLSGGPGPLSLGSHPFPLLAGVGVGEPTPTQEIAFIGFLGLGLGTGFRAGAGLGAPVAALLRLTAQGLRWGIVLRALVPLKQALVCGAIGAGAPAYGLGVLGALVALAAAFGLRDLLSLRYSPLRALLEAPALAPRKGGALSPLAEALLGPVGAMALALGLGLGLGMFCPGPDALANGVRLSLAIRCAPGIAGVVG